MAANKLSIDLGLPAIPETQNGELFKELVRVYNAINSLATGVDQYTQDGSVIAAVQALDTIVTGLNTIVTTGAFSVIAATGAFGVNNKPPQTPATLPAAATDLPTAITLVNAIRTALIANGIGI